MKRINLIQPPSDLVTNDRLEPPLGLMYLSSYLKSFGQEVRILDFSGGYSPEISEADIIGFSTFTPSYSWCLKKQKELRKKFPNAVMIAGGCHVSALPEECSKEWDCILIGEGEKGLLSLIRGNLQKVIEESIVKNIDTLSFPDYSDIDLDTYDRKVDGKHVLSVLTSRGCPFDCAFCNSNIWKRKRVRFRSPGDIAEEIKLLIKTFGTHNFRFVDDLFCVTGKRVEALEKVLTPLEIQYRCNGRVSQFSKKTADLLARSGCIQIAFGAESGSDKILRLMNKKQTSRQIRRSIKFAKDVGLIVRAYVIVGFPGEDWNTLNETIELMKDCKPDEIIIFAPIPFPGTKLYHYPEEFGIHEIDMNFDRYSQISEGHNTNYLISHHTAQKEEIEEMRQYAMKELSQIAWVEGVSNDINVSDTRI